MASIFDALGFTEVPDGNWPRVWWVPNSLLNILSIHASGYHRPDSTHTILDRVISSYVSIVKSLVYARERSTRAFMFESQRAMLTGMIETLECKDLSVVQREIDILKILISDSTILMNSTKEVVLVGMQNHQIVHLACHGQSSIDPSQNKLLLDDWETTPLRVVDLMSVNLESPQFAYLSTCETTKSTSA